MKKRILSVLLAVTVLACILPTCAVSVFAEEIDGLTITKNGVPAVEGEDYEWLPEGPALCIYSDGITLSGKTEGYIILCIASDLTFDNFSISYKEDWNTTLSFFSECVLTLKGDNAVINANGSSNAICVEFVSLEIAGDGNLDVKSGNVAVYGMESDIIISASGVINIDGAYSAAEIDGNLIVQESAEMFFAHDGSDMYGAIQCNGFSMGEGLALAGFGRSVSSVDYVTSSAEYSSDNGCFMVGDYVAKSVVVAKRVSSLGAKINESSSSLRLGAKYNGFLLSPYERPTVQDLGLLFYPSHLLGASALDLGNTNAARMSATAIEEFDDAKKFVDYNSFTFYVTVVGIPDKGKDTDISFRPYIIYSEGTFYGEVLERSYNSVLASED